MASGRIVVIATFEGVLGLASTLIGLGPVVEPADPEARILGGTAILLGAFLLTGAAALGLRIPHARRLGIVGAVAAAIIGLLLAGLAIASLDACGISQLQTMPCLALIGGIGLMGIAISALGLASMIILGRARSEAFRRRRHR